jgi:hypothetical protein
MTGGFVGAELVRLYAFVVLTVLGSRLALEVSGETYPTTWSERLLCWTIRGGVAWLVAAVLGYV